MGKNLSCDDDRRQENDNAGEESVDSAKISASARLMLPLLKRVEDLELSMRSLEDRYSPRSVIVDGNCSSSSSARSSCLSTPSSARKPIQDVLEEIEEKGTLVERVAHLEDRLYTLNMQLNNADWTGAQVPELTSPPRKQASMHVATPLPVDVTATHFPVINEDGETAPVNPQKKRRHYKIPYMIPHMIKSCLHPVASH